MFLRHVIVFSFIALLAGCAGIGARESVEGQGNPAQWREHKQQLSGLDGWQIDGKVGIRAPKDSGSGTLFWLQRQDYYDIRLSGPLGRGAARLTGRPGKVSLEVANQGRYDAPTPEELLEEQTGLETAGFAPGLVGTRPAGAGQQKPPDPGRRQPPGHPRTGWLAGRIPELRRNRTATGCPSASNCTAPTLTSRW